MSGVIPQVAALMGPCAAGTAYIPGLADFVPMVKGRGSMALAGPAARASAVRRGRHPGGARRLAGALPQVGRRRPRGRRRRGVHRGDQGLPLLLPANCEEAPPMRATADPVDRRDEELLDVLPESTAQALRHVRGDPAGSSTTASGSTSSRSGRSTIITCLARIGGRPVGIVANQPKHLGGILDNDSADKAARFINLCDAFGIPLRVPAGRARLHGRHEGRARGHHPPRREDALRGRARDRAEDHRRRSARPTAPATT